MIVHKNMKLAKVDPIVAHISLIFMVVYFDQLFCGVSVLSKTKGKEEKKNTKKAVWESEWVGMRIDIWELRKRRMDSVYNQNESNDTTEGGVEYY